MRIFLAYCIVVAIWTTTPLAIKWSGEGPGFLFAVTGRMVIGVTCMCLFMVLSRQPLPWHRAAVKTYLAVVVQIYASMMAVYWAAQLIPSGWISVIFGLAPLVTALVSRLALGEKNLTISKLMAYALGVYGLYIMFGSAKSLGSQAEWGIFGVLLSALLQAVGAVGIKRINAKLPALQQLTGGLLLAVPLYLLTWTAVDGPWPAQLTQLNLQAMLYLGVIASTIGFYLYYFLLTHLTATKVALISLMTPVLSLLLGHWINHEPLPKQAITGTACILAALVMHELFDRLLRRVVKGKSTINPGD